MGNRQESKKKGKEEGNLRGIDGWLILPFIHAVIWIGFILYDLFVNVPQVAPSLKPLVSLIYILLMALFVVTMIFGFMKKVST